MSLLYVNRRWRFFSTGDELKPLGEPLEAGQIYDSNRYGIKPLIENFGCEAIDLGIIPDCPETLKATFEKAQNARGCGCHLWRRQCWRSRLHQGHS